MIITGTQNSIVFQMITAAYYSHYEVGLIVFKI